LKECFPWLGTVLSGVSMAVGCGDLLGCVIF
jgi:hypothetical protein